MSIHFQPVLHASDQHPCVQHIPAVRTLYSALMQPQSCRSSAPPMSMDYAFLDFLQTMPMTRVADCYCVRVSSFWSMLELHRLARLCRGGPASPEEAPCSDRELLACRLSAFLRASAEHSGPVNEPSSLLAGLSIATAPAEAIKVVPAPARWTEEVRWLRWPHSQRRSRRAQIGAPRRSLTCKAEQSQE